MAALEEPMLTSQTAKGGLCTQGKVNRGRYNHYLHRAAATSLQQGQGVGNLHLNRTDRLVGGGEGGLPKQPCITNLTECLSLGRIGATGPRPLLAQMRHCPPVVANRTTARGKQRCPSGSLSTEILSLRTFSDWCNASQASSCQIEPE